MCNDYILTHFIFTFSGNSFQEKVIWFSFLPFCVFNCLLTLIIHLSFAFIFDIISVLYVIYIFPVLSFLKLIWHLVVVVYVVCVCVGFTLSYILYLTMYIEKGRWFYIKDCVQNFFITWCIVSVSWQAESVTMIYWHIFFFFFSGSCHFR